ncbi:GlxA family transcriptional regulator [Iodobacter ciconiae]|uniref:GlxA family transcriptional regulator n=1 Tax=Iodobacter ciconiae TaxID=2496266 RepID=A0A3S8ZQI9_9NEIS|nr:GlxA family transcriptional regulator [Iodobacter ciconiae]AZN35727.1 GlxA family transcriptional regulator [Iodobacter ciconiae]
MPAKRVVAMLIFPSVQLLDVAGPSDVFCEAARQLGDPGAYRIQLISTEPGVVQATSGLRLLAHSTLADYQDPPDTLLIAGSPNLNQIRNNTAEIDAWLWRQALTARRIGSVCSGAFVLAAAGLLDGKRATTHWNSARLLAEHFPKIQVEADSIYIKDGNIYTSAGVTAGMDLALAMVEEDFGRELALQVAKELVMFLKRPGGQSQFSSYLAAQSSERTSISRAQEYVLAHLDQELSISVLAAFCGMSERNFSRVFRSETGLTPGEYIENARIEKLRNLLETTTLALKRLADRTGYDSVDSLRRAFIRRLGLSPGDYRKRFSTTQN